MIAFTLSMDPILYFLSHSFALHATLGVVACLLGLAGGWWYWGRFEAQATRLQSELQQQKDRLQKAGREKDDVVRARDELQLGLGACQADKVRFQKQAEELRKELDALASAVAARDAEVKAAVDRVGTIESSLETLTAEAAGLREAGSRAAADVAARAAERDAALAEARAAVTQLGKAKEEAKTAAAELAKARAEAASTTAGGTRELEEAKKTLEKERAEFRSYTDRLEAEVLSLRGKLAERDRDNAELRTTGERLQEQLTRLATELNPAQPPAPAPTVPLVPRSAEAPAATAVTEPPAPPASTPPWTTPAAKSTKPAKPAKPEPPSPSGPTQIDLLQG